MFYLTVILPRNRNLAVSFKGDLEPDKSLSLCSRSNTQDNLQSKMSSGLLIQRIKPSNIKQHFQLKRLAYVEKTKPPEVPYKPASIPVSHVTV